MPHDLTDTSVAHVQGMGAHGRPLPTQHRRQPLGGTAVAAAEVDEGERLVARAGDGIDAEEAIRRLEATAADSGLVADVLADPYAYELEDEILRLVGVTSVPGGCVITQPWGYGPSMPGLHSRLSAGTVSYGLYANPKSGNQGSIHRDGVGEGWDLHPGGGPDVGDSPGEVLFSYVYCNHAVAYSLAFAGLRPTDARAVVGPPDHWVELPDRDYWTV